MFVDLCAHDTPFECICAERAHPIPKFRSPGQTTVGRRTLQAHTVTGSQ